MMKTHIVHMFKMAIAVTGPVQDEHMDKKWKDVTRQETHFLDK